MAYWTINLNEYAKATEGKIKKARKAYAFALYSSIVKKTPVDTGRARGNWQVTVGKPATEEIDSNRKTPRGKDSIPEPTGDESIFIANNVPYIVKLEYGGYPNPPKKGNGKTVNGYSKQAPEGMVGLTLANNENIFNAAVKAIEGGK